MKRLNNVIQEVSMVIDRFTTPLYGIAEAAGYPKVFATGGQADDLIVDVAVARDDIDGDRGDGLALHRPPLLGRRDLLGPLARHRPRLAQPVARRRPSRSRTPGTATSVSAGR